MQRSLRASTSIEGRVNRKSLSSMCTCIKAARPSLDTLNTRGRGDGEKTEDQPHAKTTSDAGESPKQRRLAMLESRRCGAKTRKGGLCRSPAMPNGRCRMHGGKSTGAPKGNKNAWKHGRYSEVAKAERSFVKQLLKDGRKLLSKRET